jgi:predicted nucleotidyltransferase
MGEEAKVMRRKEAINLLRQHQAEFAAHGVRALYLFGSTRRDEARPDSDVDLFIDYAERFPCSIWWRSRRSLIACSAHGRT